MITVNSKSGPDLGKLNQIYSSWFYECGRLCSMHALHSTCIGIGHMYSMCGVHKIEYFKTVLFSRLSTLRCKLHLTYSKLF